MTELLSSNVLSRLERYEKFEWSQATDDCNAGLSIRIGREVLAELRRLMADVAQLEDEKYRKVWDTHNAGYDAGYEAAQRAGHETSGEPK